MKLMPTDLLLCWVDDKDPRWQKEKSEAEKRYPLEEESSTNIRFESWDNLQYWFRAVEGCLPWFRKVVFVTWGHLPAFLRRDHPKLEIVRHEEYIPECYRPTFNSNTIEMNVHRIPGLSENYVLFNDDTLPLQPIPEGYFFKNGRVCDEAVENIITTASFGPVSNMARYCQVNNMFIINKHFKKREVQGKHPEQWFNEEYGERLERTKSLWYWRDFPGFYDPHLANAMKKSTLMRLWELEGEVLDRASRNHFRAHNDVSQYLIRYWQLCEGDFYPRRSQGKVFFVDINNYREVAESIKRKEYPIVSLNESCSEAEFIEIKDTINSALKELFPCKSSFEK